MSDASAKDIFDGFEKRSNKIKSIMNALKGHVKPPSGAAPSYMHGAFSSGGKVIKSDRDLKRIQAGIRRSGTEGVPESFVAEVPMFFMPKKHTRKIRRGMNKYISQPAMAVDTAVGKQLQKIPGAKRLFTAQEKVPWGASKDMLEKTVDRASATAPLSKVTRFATPLVVASGIEEQVRKRMDKKKNPGFQNKMAGCTMLKTEEDILKVAQADGMDRQLREKVASTMLRLHRQNKEHEKQAQAVKLIYKRAELGLEAVPQSYDAMQQKIASLIGQDMTVLEKALELTAGSSGLGVLANSEPTLSSNNAETTFQSAVLA